MTLRNVDKHQRDLKVQQAAISDHNIVYRFNLTSSSARASKRLHEADYGPRAVFLHTVRISANVYIIFFFNKMASGDAWSITFKISAKLISSVPSCLCSQDSTMKFTKMVFHIELTDVYKN